LADQIEECEMGGKERNRHGILVGKPEKSVHLEDTVLYGRVI
jgi:hypothetical protein